MRMTQLLTNHFQANMTGEAFIQELKKLLTTFPKPPLHIESSENCQFSNMIWSSKNVSYCFDCAQCTDCIYLYDSFLTANCVDCDYAVESELCYESVDPFKAFNCNYVNYCSNTQDASFCDNCWNCHDLFGCVNLVNKSFCIFNRQLTEEEYKEKVKAYKTWPAEKVLAVVEDLKTRFPLTQTIGAHNTNSDYGNYVHYNKNCFLCFDAAHNENCAYLYDSFTSKMSFDMTYGGKNVELGYEIIDCPQLFNCSFMVYCKNCADSAYLFNCFGVKNSLGCVGLRYKEYCILNRQLRKEEYEKVSKQILQDLTVENIGWNGLYY